MRMRKDVTGKGWQALQIKPQQRNARLTPGIVTYFYGNIANTNSVNHNAAHVSNKPL
jgi:hypothetical protein